MLTPAGLALLRHCEGCEAQVYLDVAGYATIGVGHLLTTAERSSGKIKIGDIWVRYAPGLTEPQIEQLLHQDLGRVAEIVDLWVDVPLTPAQRDVLISLAFNIGTQAFQRSTLLTCVNAGALDQVPTQLARWVYSAGTRVPGLVQRRALEAAHWRGAA